MKEYTSNLHKLLSTKSLEYAKLGLCRNGSQIQLNDNLLQKESEFYSPIHFKHTPKNGETNLKALEKGGVQYLEVRIIDLNPYEKISLSLQQLYFLQVFMLFCLFESSELISETEMKTIDKNHHAAALFGRNPNLELTHYLQGPISLKKWAGELFGKLQTIAGLIDQTVNRNIYQAGIEAELKKVTDISLLPSSRIQREMELNHESFLEFGIRKALMNQSFTKEFQEVGNGY